MPPRAKKSAKSAVAPDAMPVMPSTVTPTAAATATEVKTKVVSKTAMAIAVAFLGFAAIAAGMLTLPQSGPSGSNCFDSDYATKNDGGSSVLRYSFINQAIKGTAYGIQTNSTQFVSSTDKCWNGKKLLEFFCDVKNNKVTWNSYNCAAGTSCVDGACVSAGKPDIIILDISMSPNTNDPTKKDVSVTLKNVGNAAAPPFVVNLYQKNTDGNNEVLVWAELSAMDPGITTVYANYGLSLPATVTLASEVDPNNQVAESNETNNYLEKSFTEIGKMNFKVVPLLSNKLLNGNHELGTVELSALNEPMTVNSLKFTVWPVSGYSTTTVSALYLVDYNTYYNGDTSQKNIIAGPVNLVADPTKAGYYYATFDDVNFVLPAYNDGLVNWQKTWTLEGNITGVSIGSYVGVRINPAKDVVGTGMNSGKTISPAIDKLLVVSDKSY